MIKEITIRVYPRARSNRITHSALGLRVHVCRSPVDGKANEAVKLLLADYFKLRPRQIELTKGLKSRFKTFRLHF
jgi:uncharacterized protein YggU (UPF0235/DUF167 family)